MKIINTKSEELLRERKEIRHYNKKLPEINENIIEMNNAKWLICIFITVPAIFILLLFVPFNTDTFAMEIIRYTGITALSITIGIILGTKIAAPFYRPLQSAKVETEAMYMANLLYKYTPKAVARKGASYLLVLEDKKTKLLMREVIIFKPIEKSNINEIILDIDKERLYVPKKH